MNDIPQAGQKVRVTKTDEGTVAYVSGGGFLLTRGHGWEMWFTTDEVGIEVLDGWGDDDAG